MLALEAVYIEKMLAFFKSKKNYIFYYAAFSVVEGYISSCIKMVDLYISADSVSIIECNVFSMLKKVTAD